MRKKVITKPRFGKIFIVRFLICLVLLSIVAVYAIDRYYDFLLDRVIHEPTKDYFSQIVERAEALSKTEPGSDEHKDCLNDLKLSLALYQMAGYNYAEVHVGDLRMATDKDTAFFYIYGDVGYKDPQVLFIEDISYLDPLNEFLRENGYRDERQDTDYYYRYERDPNVFFSPFYHARYEYIRSAYVNRDDHTFLPGVIEFVIKDKHYEVDCTPADTKGYEKLEFDRGDDCQLIPAYRIATDLSTKDLYYHAFPVVGGETRTFDKEDFENISEISREMDFEVDNSWSVDVSGYKIDNVFVIAPFYCAFIILADLVAAVVVALVLAIIRYQKDKTVWEIFDYRVKTTEAMAHDLKTPLSTIMFYLENLEESSHDSAKVLEYKNDINDKVVAMDHMIGDILLLSKSESGKVNLNKEELSVKALVTECLKDFPGMKTEIKGDDITLITDRKVLSQAIKNLLSNCDRYGKEGSAVDIAIEPDALTITNKTDKIYDDVDSLKKPFVKGEDSRGSKGAGVGLAIADNNLAILGYKLELASEPDGFRAKVKFKT
jgi:hypothetical protein